MTRSRDIKYIDLHTHILPGIDDGAESYEEALRMAGTAYEEGIRLIVATPHYGIMNPGFNRFKAEEVFDKMKIMIQEEHPDLELLMGNEIFYTGPTVIDALAKGDAIAVADTDYVLVEFSPADSFKFIHDGIRNLTQAGYKPILAHSERYEALYKEPYLVQDLIDAGAVIQINSRSLLRRRANLRGVLRGKTDRRAIWVKELIKKDLVHLISSDCHNDGSRAPMMAAAADKLRSVTDEETFHKIMNDNPKRILENKFL